MPPLNSNDAASDEVIEIQHHLVHINADHHKSLAESINNLFHVGGLFSNGSGSGVPNSTGDSGVSEDLIIVICTLVPLIATLILIFVIAAAVRKMRRAESMQEVVRRNEFKMSRTKRGLHTSNSHPLESSFTTSPLPSNIPSHSQLSKEIRVVPASKLTSQKSFISNCSTSSSNSGVSTSPTSIYFSQVPPWFLQSTSYYRSQYHLNKLHRQLSYQNGSGSLQSFHHSMNSLNHQTNNNSGSSSKSSSSQGVDYNTMTNVSDTETESDITSMTTTSSEKKKKSKKLKKVFQIINIPKRIRQAQAEKNRFNIYTIPMETREQLKQIYVY